MLSASEIRPIAEDILRRHIPEGAVEVGIVLRADTFGDPAIFVAADIADEYLAEARRERMAMVAELRAALVGREEDRFPFLDLSSPADRAEADREDAA